jgi:2'-5' RNA ligase
MSQRTISPPNWFFAFRLDGAFALGLPAPPPAIRLVHPEDVHLTVAFLGGCGEATARRALFALGERLHRSPCQAVDVSFGEVVPMGSKQRYSALSALLDRGREAATVCVTTLRDVLIEASTGQSEHRSPRPHVTIARPRDGATDADRADGLIWAAQLDLRAIERTLELVALYTWNDDRRERLFRIVAECHVG